MGPFYDMNPGVPGSRTCNSHHGLRRGWPAGEWETGPEPKMAGEMAGEMTGGHFSGGIPKWPNYNGRANGWTAKSWPNFGCPAICPAIFRPFSPQNGRQPFRRPFLHAQYDWTTGVPDNGNDWRKFRVVPRSYPLHPLIFYFV